jgi:hypothetical protein
LDLEYPGKRMIHIPKRMVMNLDRGVWVVLSWWDPTIILMDFRVMEL